MLSVEYLKKCLVVDSYDNQLYWLDRSDINKGANTRLRFTNAFTCKNKSGYFHGRVNQKTYLAHRVIWALYYNEWPYGEIDHINGDRSDNRIENLRIATPSENRCNRGKQSNNTSGYKGVYFNKRNNSWYAEIRKSGTKKYLGSAKTPEEAYKFYTANLETHHGVFANSGD